MGIYYDEQKKLFRLNTAESSYVIGVFERGYLLCLYYGARIEDMPFDRFKIRPNSFSPYDPLVTDRDFTTDSSPMEYGCNGSGDFRISALSVRNKNGDNVTDIRYESHRIFKGKPAIPGLPSSYATDENDCSTLEIDAVDAVTGLRVTLVYTVFETQSVMTRSVRVHNDSADPLVIERVFSACVDFPTMDYDIITLHGRHCRERHIDRRPLAHGIQGVLSKRGVSSHNQNPFVAFARKGTTEEFGDAYGFNLVYSGNFSAMAECDYNASTRFIMGINPEDFEWTLQPGDTFCAPEVVCVYSDHGLGEMSRIFHRFYNRNMIRGKFKTAKRPMLINSWEAAYFDFDTQKLLDFADEAKALGIEMLVMDDGWFGQRNDDTNSLGDWTVNTKKLPGGLKPLIDGVHARGLKFGIWFEPEMISPDSDLFRAHPDWHVHVQDREPRRSRYQYVIDMSREDVRENIWQQMYKILSENDVDYVKWDFNRHISDAGSASLPPERQKEFFHRFILGTYELLDRFVKTFPDILLEGCSGGGGRFDPAMLCFSPQIWTSDHTDPIERLKIQFGTSMCYPASAQGAHVSANSRTGYATKGNVAMWGTFGYELDPRKLSEEEKQIVRDQIRDYHKYYDLNRYGDLYRLVSPFEDEHYAVWEIVSPEKDACLCTVVCVKHFFCGSLYVRLRGLDPDRMYTCDYDGQQYSGNFLMRVGYNLTDVANRDGESAQLYFHA